MGIPTLFRWLKDRYPKILQNNDAAPRVDNLYIDMNGMIHPCFHPEGRDAPKNLNEVFQEIFIYLDKIMEIANPQKLLYLAIDGPAPRAKLNQQRLRRFSAAYESQTKSIFNLTSSHDESVSKSVPEKAESLDSNVITPGTPFMTQLSRAIKQWIAARQSCQLSHLAIIFSDAQTPGEGEHKIMHYIRAQRQHAHYDPNTSHCVHGLDADLIMLALASHEPNFYILREVVFMEKNQVVCKSCGSIIKKESFHFEKCPNAPADQVQFPIVNSKAFQFLSVLLFREYLMKEFNCPPEQFERVVDDFVFLCFLSGNDFLPHMHSMRINDNAILRIVDAYKRFYLKGVFITNSGLVDVVNFVPFLKYFAQYEKSILVNMERSDNKREMFFRQNFVEKIKEKLEKEDDPNIRKQLLITFEKSKFMTEMEIEVERRNEYYENIQIDPKDTKTLAIHYKIEKFSFEDPQWKRKYYKNASPKDIAEMSYQFLRGMFWVNTYYCNELTDWSYYYPFYEAPLLQDFTNFLENNISKCQQIPNSFAQNSKPFTPYEQLLAVLPPHSFKALPAALQPLMLDSNSPLSKFYPNKFDVDVSGKTQLYQGIVELPFIDEADLRQAYESVKANLSPEEVERNTPKNEVIFANFCTKLGNYLKKFDKQEQVSECKMKINKAGVQVYHFETCENIFSGLYAQSKADFFGIGQQFIFDFESKTFAQIVKKSQDAFYTFSSLYENIPFGSFTNQSVQCGFKDGFFKKPFINYTLLNRQFVPQVDKNEWDRSKQYRDRKTEDSWRGLEMEQTGQQNIQYKQGQMFVPSQNFNADRRFGGGIGRFVDK
ncbi:5'-3'_exoribonuclease 2 [Hexamita inflata]|uniref:5'-3' exoribonuclease 2 n=1 Tax=Hexamita inflata TaxID=28002 RepID=A0AA86UX40_9EUKA|nr:5'-3' exoribonuclease 2 [Hexamita inflata]